MREEERAPEARADPRNLPEGLIPPDLRSETEALLTAMRQWIYAEEEARAGTEPYPGEEELPKVDLHSILEELTALRGEVRLESRVAKASRERMDHAAEAFEQGLEDAREVVRETAGGMETGFRQSLAPLIRERDRLRDELERVQEDPLRESLETMLDMLEVLRRGRRATEGASRRLGWRAWLLPQGVFGGILEGYDIALRKVERSLEALGVEEISCKDCEFDPRRMRSVETEARGDLPQGWVLEVIRPGFLRGEKVLRYAEVRTAKEA